MLSNRREPAKPIRTDTASHFTRDGHQSHSYFNIGHIPAAAEPAPDQRPAFRNSPTIATAPTGNAVLPGAMM